MSDTIIKVENLSKRYLLSHLADKREQLFSRLLVNKFKDAGSRLGGAFRRNSKGGDLGGSETLEEFWALDDVSFEIKQGDRVGIIGRNGAGKSTLLKILSRITEPTRGRIAIDGRVASLLEVGTGFHSELSGRENIYLNGAILGMSREEIKRKFDEIVAFAEVEKFLDTPVKRYSSGMYVRLAFAVAAHLEPEILIIDEVLAVGDAQFQKKCLGKMEDVSTKEGRTVLFVSHNMGAIARLCRSALWLNAGRVKGVGSATDVLHDYQAQDVTSCAAWTLGEAYEKKQDFIFERIEVVNSGNEVCSAFDADEAITINTWYTVNRDLAGCQTAYRVYNADGMIVMTTADTDGTDTSAVPRAKGSYFTRVTLPAKILTPGTYYLSVAAHLPYQAAFDVVEQPVTFTVTTTGWIGVYDGRSGMVSPVYNWSTVNCDRFQIGSRDPV